MLHDLYLNDDNYGRHTQYGTGDTPFNPIRSETLLVEPPTMISNLTRGIASLTTACQCVLTLLLFSLWIVLYQLVSGAPRLIWKPMGLTVCSSFSVCFSTR